MKLYLVSHNGLGDNLYMIGALHFLQNFYEKIFFLCKDNYYDNVCLFFSDTTKITPIMFDSKNEYNSINEMIINKYNDNNTDIFICGVHKGYLQSKITNAEFLNFQPIDKNYTVDYDTLTTQNYNFIEGFYKDIRLNLTYCFEYFYLPRTQESIDLYDSISKYYIIFIQRTCSNSNQLNIDKIIEKYKDDDNTIIVCSDENIYNFENKTENQLEKYNLCKPFVYNKLVNYDLTIRNSDEIHIIDSCFTGIVLPYLKTNRLKTNKVRIINRNIL